MNSLTGDMKTKVTLLKEARKQLMSLHKLLVDQERRLFESNNGPVTSGQFLSLLLEDPNFQWLRKFSTLIVEIDETLDLDDGFTEDMIEKYLSQMSDLINFVSIDDGFESKYKSFIQTNSEIAAKQGELKKLLNKE